MSLSMATQEYLNSANEISHYISDIGSEYLVNDIGLFDFQQSSRIEATMDERNIFFVLEQSNNDFLTTQLMFAEQF